MRKLRLGIIGAGAWAVTSHLPNLEPRRDVVEFTGVCRKGAADVARVRDRFGFRMGSEDHTDVLDAGVDVCIVASPAGLHHEHARDALDAGAHVLVEKPFTIAPEHAWDLVDRAERLGRHLLVSFGWHYRPMVLQAKRMLDDPGIGRVEHVMVHMASVVRELLLDEAGYPELDPQDQPDEGTFTDPSLAGGGYGQTQLSPALGLAFWLLGVRAREAFALTVPPGEPIDVHDAVSLRFDGGAAGTVSGGSCHLGSNDNKHQMEIRAIGSDGQVHVDLERELLWLYRASGDELRPPVRPGDGRYDCVGPPNTLVDLALGRDVPNHSPGELGAATVEALDAIYRSAASGRLETVRRHAPATDHPADTTTKETADARPAT